ncbi:Catsper1 [Symbiodinium sp. CCMP2592]|nr:Catsper1 [Symbiodinium sp. CCMP2592]
MERDAFINLLDQCWNDFRQQAIAAYPGEAASLKGAPSTAGLQEPILRDHLFKDVPEAMPQSSLKETFSNRMKYDLVQDQRLRIRLGLQPDQKLISGKSLHAAVSALGLSCYSVEDMNDLVNAVAAHVGLHFKESSKDSAQRTPSGDEAELLGLEPVWRMSGASAARCATAEEQRTDNVVPAQALLELLLANDGQADKTVFKQHVLLRQFQSMREILLASHANQLVADLSVVRINDLAAPPEPWPLTSFEPFFACVLVSYGIMLAFQLDPAYASWHGWFYIEVAFTIFLVIDILLRMHLLRCRAYWCGSDCVWNWFDILLAVVSVTSFFFMSNGSTTLPRILRLFRLIRIVKDLRLRVMKELRLMINGWLAGLRTIATAFILLVYVLYIISALATALYGRSHPEQFGTVPAAMFTAFRCYTGDCSDREGFPLTVLLAEEFGSMYVLGYVVSYMLVTMGIFNVILAIYVDITLKAAKGSNARSPEQHALESVHVARCARELLKKFVTAYRDFMGHDAALRGDVTDAMQEHVQITKELFQVIIQDRAVQELMDELDLPPNRTNLFGVIDADGSGALDARELVHGMLSLRGELTKSDVVATLLASKSLHNMFLQMKQECLQTLATMPQTCHSSSQHDALRKEHNCRRPEASLAQEPTQEDPNDESQMDVYAF